jgi:ABC-2 type transport system permease protein
MRTEWHKLRTVRGPWLLVAAQLLLTGLAVAGSIVAGIPDDRMVLAHGGVPSIFALVLGIGAVAGEQRHRTITDTFLSTPRRGRVLAAKLATYTLVGLAVGVASAAVTAAVAVLGGDVDLGDTANLRMLAGIAIWNALYAALGVGLGALVGNLTGAIVIALAWIALVEQALSRLFDAVADWLPLASAQSLANLPDAGASQLTGGLVLAGYAAVLCVAAAVALGRRDVT